MGMRPAPTVWPGGHQGGPPSVGGPGGAPGRIPPPCPSPGPRYPSLPHRPFYPLPPRARCRLLRAPARARRISWSRPCSPPPCLVPPRAVACPGRQLWPPRGAGRSAAAPSVAAWPSRSRSMRGGRLPFLPPPPGLPAACSPCPPAPGPPRLPPPRPRPGYPTPRPPVGCAGGRRPPAAGLAPGRPRARRRAPPAPPSPARVPPGGAAVRPGPAARAAARAPPAPPARRPPAAARAWGLPRLAPGPPWRAGPRAPRSQVGRRPAPISGVPPPSPWWRLGPCARAAQDSGPQFGSLPGPLPWPASSPHLARASLAGRARPPRNARRPGRMAPGSPRDGADVRGRGGWIARGCARLVVLPSLSPSTRSTRDSPLRLRSPGPQSP